MFIIMIISCVFSRIYNRYIHIWTYFYFQSTTRLWNKGENIVTSAWVRTARVISRGDDAGHRAKVVRQSGITAVGTLARPQRAVPEMSSCFARQSYYIVMHYYLVVVVMFFSKIERNNVTITIHNTFRKFITPLFFFI